MASEHPGDTTLTLPESLSDWLDDKAESENLTREDVLLQLLSTYQREGDAGEQALDGGEISVEPTEGPVEELVAELRTDVESIVERRLQDHEAEGVSEDRLRSVVSEVVDDRVEEQVDERLAEMVEDAVADAVESGAFGDDIASALEADLVEASDLDDFESRFVELLEDVRERVVQVKREADAKAGADHGHPALAEEVSSLSTDLEDLGDSVEAVESQVDAGFENFEEVLSYLTDSLDEVAARQTTLARAVVETRDQLRNVAAAQAARSAAGDLRRSANKHGISSAACGACESQVDISLLDRAQCPHCSATFTDVEPSKGFFGTNTLQTGDRPALEPGSAEAEGFEYEVEEIIESGSPTEDASIGGDEAE